MTSINSKPSKQVLWNGPMTENCRVRKPSESVSEKFEAVISVVARSRSRQFKGHDLGA